MRRLWAAVLAIVVSGPALAQPPPVCLLPRIGGAEYPTARETLIRAGWQPVEIERDPSEFVLEWAEPYDEVQMCASEGLAPCAFIFQRRQMLLRVITAGEEMGFVSAVECGAR